MVKVPHTLKFVTEFNETHPIAQQFLANDEKTQVMILEELLYELMLPRLEEILEEVNNKGTYAILKVVK